MKNKASLCCDCRRLRVKYRFSSPGNGVFRDKTEAYFFFVVRESQPVEKKLERGIDLETIWQKGHVQLQRPVSHNQTE